MLNERESRKPGFSEGAKVVLADGQEWTLPKPRLVFFPARGDDGKYLTRMRLSYGREYDPVFADAFRAESEGDEEAVVSAKMTLACMLLCSNYELDGDDLAGLLEIHPEDADSVAWWTALNDAVLSQARLATPEPAGKAE